MAEFKIVIADPKTGKCHQREIKDDETNVFLGLKIGNKIKGDSFNLQGYEFEITGGSDKSGFPMRKDLDTTARKKILAVEGVGLKRKRKGQRQRKSVRGNTISSQISQINLKILKYGKEKLGVEESPAEEKKTEEKPAETPKKGATSEEKPKEEPKPKKEEKAPESKSENNPKEETKASTEEKKKSEESK